MWELLHPQMTVEQLGFLPFIILPFDPRPASEQLEDRYAHGGGYQPYGQDKWSFDAESHALSYPDDAPDMMPMASIELPDTHETLYVYDFGITAIVQADGSFAVCRLD